MKYLLLLHLCIFSLFANEVVKGKTYYQYILKDKLGYDGAVFAKKYTKKEWEKKFSNNAQLLKKELLNENQELSKLISSEKFKKISPFIKAFVQHYAKDVKNTPSCN